MFITFYWHDKRDFCDSKHPSIKKLLEKLMTSLPYKTTKKLNLNDKINIITVYYYSVNDLCLYK